MFRLQALLHCVFHSTPFTLRNLLDGELTGKRRSLPHLAPQDRTQAFLTKSKGDRQCQRPKNSTSKLENRPGTLAKLCKGLADRKVNIVAFQASTDERRSQVHLVVDNVAAAKTVLDAERLTYTENDVAQVALPNRAGELARVAGRLGEANINIDHAYGGVEPNTNTPLLFFGVAEAWPRSPTA